MKEIHVPQCREDALNKQLKNLYTVFKNIQFGEKVNFNLNETIWASPLIILPISAYISETKSNFSYEKSNILPYLNTVCFPIGVDSVTAFQEQSQKTKNYIPISILRKQDREKREKLESLFLEMLFKSLGKVKGSKNAIYYPLSELVSNIFDHSKKDKGSVFGQMYETKNFLDVCIVDCGRGLSRAYKEEKKMELSDTQAIERALEGLSTKPSIERGFGIRTSVKVVCEGLKGGFVLLSGNSLFFAVQKKKYLAELPNFFWQGVIIAYRIPRPSKPINIQPYIE